jgi:hypothetical protein
MAKTRTHYTGLLEALHELDTAERKSLAACAAREALPAGSTRARVTTANARWMSASEHRDRCLAHALEAVRETLPTCRPYDHMERWIALVTQPTLTPAEVAEQAFCQAVLKEQGRLK